MIVFVCKNVKDTNLLVYTCVFKKLEPFKAKTFFDVLYAKENGYSNITDADDVAMIKTFYDMFREKAPFEKFVEKLAAMKSVNAH